MDVQHNYPKPANRGVSHIDISINIDCVNTNNCFKPLEDFKDALKISLSLLGWQEIVFSTQYMDFGWTGYAPEKSAPDYDLTQEAIDEAKQKYLK